MGTSLISIIGSLIVFLLGLMLYMLKATRNDVKELDTHMEEMKTKFEKELAESVQKILDRVYKPDCIREMGEIRTDLKEAIRDIRVLERIKANQ